MPRGTQLSVEESKLVYALHDTGVYVSHISHQLQRSRIAICNVLKRDRRETPKKGLVDLQKLVQELKHYYLIKHVKGKRLQRN
jgi:hypothetical protein